MTFFAKWTDPAVDLTSGFCLREMFPAQVDVGGELRAMDYPYTPDWLFVDAAGILKHQEDARVVEVEYLSDAKLDEYEAAVIANAPDEATATKCVQHLQSAQTCTEAEAIIASYGIDITPEL